MVTVLDWVELHCNAYHGKSEPPTMVRGLKVKSITAGGAVGW